MAGAVLMTFAARGVAQEAPLDEAADIEEPAFINEEPPEIVAQEPAKSSGEYGEIETFDDFDFYGETDASGDPAAAIGARLPDAPTFQVHGYIQNQTGIFFGWEKAKKGTDGLPTDHGDKLGKWSMFRNTLQLEAAWNPTPKIGVRAIIRGVKSLKLSVDKDAQVPHAGYYGNDQKTIDWVYDNYYNELDVRELYVDLEAADWLSFRVGRQQVSWGESGQYRTLDVVNPIDSSWHFGPLESFEDQRVPMWMLKTLVAVRPLQGMLELVWLPMLDRPEDTVTVPLTFVGAWGLPPVPGPEYYGRRGQTDESVAPWKIHEKIFHYPGREFKDSRIGGRWQGEAGRFTYSLVYYYTHQMSPPIPLYTVAPYGAGNQGVDVHVGFPRQHIAGFSLETTIPYPLGTNVKMEASYEPNRTYPVQSLKPRDAVIMPNKDVYQYYRNMEKHVLNYSVSLQQPALIRWLNPEQSLMFVVQFMHSAILNYDAADRMIDVPGYDTTTTNQHSFTIVGAVFTNYLNGMLTPRLIGAYMPNNGGFLSAQLGATLGNNWRLLLSVNQFFGDNPYKGVGFFRDRDEVNLRIRYQF
jgi:hypothetical protein